MPLSPPLFEYFLDVLTPGVKKAGRGGREVRHADWKGKVKTFLMYNMIVYVVSPKESAKNC